MVNFLLKWLVSKGLPEGAAKVLLVLGAATVLTVAVVGAKKLYDRSVIKQHDAETTIEVLERQAPANDKAASTRAKDEIIIYERARKRNEAIQAVPDETPTAADLALNCQRLRDAGTDTSTLSACAGY